MKLKDKKKVLISNLLILEYYTTKKSMNKEKPTRTAQRNNDKCSIRKEHNKESFL